MVLEAAVLDNPPSETHSGIVASLLETGGAQADMLKPAERIAFEALEIWQDALNQSESNEVEVGSIKLSADTSQFFLAQHAEDGLIAIAQVAGWAHPMVIGFADELVFDLIELVLGGDGSEPAFRPQRELSPLERELAGHLARQLFECLDTVLSRRACRLPEMTVTVLEKDFAADKVGLKDCGMMGATFSLTIGKETHKAMLCLPRDALENISKALNDNEQAAAKTDPEWTGKLTREVHLAPVDIEACLDGGELTLDRLSRLQPGDVLQLPARENNLVNLSCNGTALMKCKLGQAHGRFHVRIEAFVADEECMMETVTGTARERGKRVSGND